MYVCLRELCTAYRGGKTMCEIAVKIAFWGYSVLERKQSNSRYIFLNNNEIIYSVLDWILNIPFLISVPTSHKTNSVSIIHINAV